MCGCVCMDTFIFFIVSMNRKPDGMWWSPFSRVKSIDWCHWQPTAPLEVTQLSCFLWLLAGFSSSWAVNPRVSDSHDLLAGASLGSLPLGPLCDHLTPCPSCCFTDNTEEVHWHHSGSPSLQSSLELAPVHPHSLSLVTRSRTLSSTFIGKNNTRAGTWTGMECGVPSSNMVAKGPHLKARCPHISRLRVLHGITLGCSLFLFSLSEREIRH